MYKCIKSLYIKFQREPRFSTQDNRGVPYDIKFLLDLCLYLFCVVFTLFIYLFAVLIIQLSRNKRQNFFIYALSKFVNTYSYFKLKSIFTSCKDDTRYDRVSYILYLIFCRLQNLHNKNNY